MKKLNSWFKAIQPLLIVMAIVAAWAGSSALFGWIIEQVMPCMSLGIFIAGVMLLAASDNENSWRRLTGQPYDEKVSSGLLLGCITMAPFIILFAALLAFLGDLTFRSLGLIVLNISV